MPRLSSVSTAVSSSGEPAVANATTAPAGRRSAQRHDRGGAEWTGRVAALRAQAERGEQRARRGERLVDGSDRHVACGVMIGAGSDVREHLRACPSLRPRRTRASRRARTRPCERLSQVSPRRSSGQRRLEHLEHRRLAPRPAHAGHDLIVHVTDDLLAPLRSRYGKPIGLDWAASITAREHALATYNPERAHDVTLFILDARDPPRADSQAALRRGIWRPPGGGIKPGENFAAGAEREALEETGLRVTLERYLVAASASFLLRRDGRCRGRRTCSPRAPQTRISSLRTPRDRRPRGGDARRARRPAARDAPRDGPRPLALPGRAARRLAGGARAALTRHVARPPASDASQTRV